MQGTKGSRVICVCRLPINSHIRSVVVHRPRRAVIVLARCCVDNDSAEMNTNNVYRMARKINNNNNALKPRLASFRYFWMNTDEFFFSRTAWIKRIFNCVLFCVFTRSRVLWLRRLLCPKRVKTYMSAKLHYTDTGYGLVYNTTNGQKFATSQHLDLSRCWALALRCGKFVVQQVVELLWACPLVVLYNISIVGVRVVEFGIK